jgi:hypothetical protein
VDHINTGWNYQVSLLLGTAILAPYNASNKIIIIKKDHKQHVNLEYN